MTILNLQGVPSPPVVVVGSGYDFLFKSLLAHCVKANVSEEKGEFKYYYGKVMLFCVGISKEPCRRENFGRFSTKNFAAKQLNNCQT